MTRRDLSDSGRHVAMDVMAEMASFLQIFLKHTAVDVADGNDTSNGIVVEDRQVPDAALHKQSHSLIDRGGVSRSDQIRGHHSLHLRGLGIGTWADDAAEHVAFGEDAEQLVVSIHDQHSTDVALVHDVHGFTHSCGGGDSSHRCAFLGQDMG